MSVFLVFEFRVVLIWFTPVNDVLLPKLRNSNIFIEHSLFLVHQIINDAGPFLLITINPLTCCRSVIFSWLGLASFAAINMYF